MDSKKSVNEQFSANNIQVLLPYEQLINLLGAAGEVNKLRDEVKRLKRQMDTIRGIQLEIMEKVGEINRLI